MHPAHHIAARLHHQTVAVVTEPGGYGESYTWPLVRRALGIAVDHHAAVIEPDFPLAEAGLAETCAGDDSVVLSGGRFEFVAQICLYRVKISIAP